MYHRNFWTRPLVAIAFAISLSAPRAAVPHQLQVPFFQDDGGQMSNHLPTLGGAAAFIAVFNTRGEEITMYLVYSQEEPSGSVIMQQAVSYKLAAYEAVIFRPVKDDPVEGRGRAVPNVLPGLGANGSLQIIWIGGPEMASAISGRFRQISLSGDMGHVLL